MAASDSRQFVIVGLGNPGAKYEKTRHNIGALTVSALAAKMGFSFKEEKRHFSQVAKGEWEGERIHLILPKTYMNDSGRAVLAYLNYYDLNQKSLIVVSDDVDLAFQKMRLKEKGSAGGHNGLKSIECALGTKEYIRLRMGIGEKRQGQDLADHVLNGFSSDELKRLPLFIEGGVNALLGVIREGIAPTMNIVNTRIKTPHEEQEIKHESNRKKESL